MVPLSLAESAKFLSLMADSSVYERLRTLIIRGRLAPGARLVENDIAARLGVSRTPAREAIIRLYREGFLVATATTRRTELVVAPMTLEDLEDLYRIMGALEGAAVLGVARLDASTKNKLIEDLERIEKKFEDAGNKKKVDFEKLFELHNAFHGRLVDATAGKRLRSLIEMVRPQVERYEWVYAPLVGPGYEETFTEHQVIIRSLRDKSGARAQAAVIANWERGGERLARAIGTMGSRGDW